MEKKRGLLFVLSGPSGVGKGTVRALMDLDALHTKMSVSATTRKPRAEDIDGVTYHFVTHDQFQKMIDNDEFLEYAQFVNNSYGTPLQSVEDMRNQGINVLLEIEINGAMQVMEKCPDAISMFLVPPSLEELEHRIRTRGSECEAEICKRLETAKKEMAMRDRYQYVVVNDDKAKAAAQLSSIIRENIEKSTETVCS